MNARSAIVLLAAAGLWAAPAWGLINPNFTPIHLAEESQTILVVKIAGGKVLDKTGLEVVKVLKGKAPTTVSLDLSGVVKEHADAVRKALTAAAGQEMLLLAGKFEQQEVGFLHANGIWLRMAGGTDTGQWKVQVLDGDMQTTWAGGTDMLIRCTEYVLQYRGEASVPVEAGTAWRGEPVKVGSVAAAGKGKPSAVAVVDLAGDGKIRVYVASPDGDRLFRPGGASEFEDVTAKVGLKSASRAFAWGEFTADGRADLLSFDGKDIWLWRQNADGTFSQAKAGGSYSVPADCPGLATVGLSADGLAAVVVAGAMPPVVLRPDGKGAFAAEDLAPPEEKVKAALGKPQPPLTGDFNNDALPDVLLPFEKDGLLYLGRKAGGFDPPKVCGVHCTAGGGRAAIGDFDGDGWLDVLAAGGEGIRVFHNRRDGTFAETLGVSGEIAYKGQPFASGCGTCDFNNDSRVDLFLTYSAQAALLYFNRGFRSFGEAPKLEQGLAAVPELEKGQQAGSFADFDGDGAEDFLLLLPDGSVYVAFNDLGDQARGVRLRLSGKAPWAGPVNVTAWSGQRLLGARLVRAGDPTGFLGVSEAGRYTLKWTFPDGKELTHAVTVESGTVDVLLDRDGKPAEKAP